MNYKDVITALKSMGSVIFSFLLVLAKATLILVVGLVVCAIIAYVITHHFLVLLALFGIAVISGWFYIEYTTARVIREYEEKED